MFTFVFTTISCLPFFRQAATKNDCYMLYAGCYMKRKSSGKNTVLAIPGTGGTFPATNFPSAPFSNSSLNSLPGILRGLPFLFIDGPKLSCIKHPGKNYGTRL